VGGQAGRLAGKRGLGEVYVYMTLFIYDMYRLAMTIMVPRGVRAAFVDGCLGAGGRVLYVGDLPHFCFASLLPLSGSLTPTLSLLSLLSPVSCHATQHRTNVLMETEWEMERSGNGME